MTSMADATYQNMLNAQFLQALFKHNCSNDSLDSEGETSVYEISLHCYDVRVIASRDGDNYNVVSWNITDPEDD